MTRCFIYFSKHYAKRLSEMLLTSRGRIWVYEKTSEIASFNLFFLSSKALKLVSDLDQSLEIMVITQTTSVKETQTQKCIRSVISARVFTLNKTKNLYISQF